MREEWVEIPEYPNYLVSNFGEINNMRFRRFLNPRDNGKGYLQVALHSYGTREEFYVHLLVAEAFLEDYRDGLQVEHVDGNTQNNIATNLQIRNAPQFLTHVEPAEKTRGRKVQVVETGAVFMSARHAAAYLKGDHSKIYLCLRDGWRTHRGYHFKYFEGRTE